jgi:hypothetical protein
VYSISLFLHIVGALGLCAALGLEWAGLYNLRRATEAGQVREWVRLLASPGSWEVRPRSSSSSPAST